jgi:putative heme transporter
VADRRRLGLRPVAVAALELLLVAAALALIAWVAIRLRLVVLPVVLAIFLSVFLVPIADVLRRIGVPRTLSTLIAMFGALALLAGLIAALAPPVVDQTDELEQEVTRGIDDLLSRFGVTEQEVNRYLDQAVEQLQANSQSIGQGVVSGAFLLVEVITGVLLALVVLFFFVNDGPRIWRWVVDQAPSRVRGDVDTLGHRAWSTVGGYLRGVGIVATVDAVLIGLVLAILGVPLVPALMALTFFGAFFPIVGATVAGIAAALVTLVTEGTVDAIIVVAAILVIQELEGDILYPLIVGRSINLHPVAILLLLTAGGVVAGVVGALLAIPFGAVVWEVVRYVRDERGDRDDRGPPPADTAAIAPPSAG